MTSSVTESTILSFSLELPDVKRVFRSSRFGNSVRGLSLAAMRLELF